MAAVDSTEAPAATGTKQRPVKPDQATFEAGLEALEKELKAKSDKQVCTGFYFLQSRVEASIYLVPCSDRTRVKSAPTIYSFQL
jgi:hypothetical protein